MVRQVTARPLAGYTRPEPSRLGVIVMTQATHGTAATFDESKSGGHLREIDLTLGRIEEVIGRMDRRQAEIERKRERSREKMAEIDEVLRTIREMK